MTLTINGTDITEYIKFGGIAWSLNSVDAEGAGRNLNGEMQRKLVALKHKFEVTCVPLTNAQRETIATLLSNQWLTVVYTPTGGSASTYTMYCGSTVKASYLIKKDNQDLWDGFSFSLIQK